MKRQIVALAIVTSILLTACHESPKTDQVAVENSTKVEAQSETLTKAIPYAIAKNYFVKNTFTKLDNPKIETAEKFNEVFGMATTMGKDGKPTEIDFTKQYAIAVILPETDSLTTINPLSLSKNEQNDIVLTYQSKIGEKQSYKMRPSFIIIVDKAENGNVILKEIR